MKKLDKSLNFYPIIIYLVTSLVFIVLIGSAIWLNEHKRVNISLSDDMQNTAITTTTAVNFDVQRIGVIIVSFILISLVLLFFIQLMQKKRIIYEIQSLSAGMLKDDFSLINNNYSYSEFETIKDSYNEKIYQIQDQVTRKDEYFNMTVHDLRSPIQAVKNNITLLEQFPGDSEIISDLKEEIRHLELEVSRYLLLERIDYFEQPNFQKVELSNELQAFQKKYALDNEFVIIDCKNQFDTKVDRLMLEKILMNLVQNGLRYSSNKQVKITLQDNCLLVSNCTDQYIPQIFNNKRTKSCHGNGIGTQIIQKYASILNLSLEEANTEKQVNIKLVFKDNNEK